MQTKYYQNITKKGNKIQQIPNTNGLFYTCKHTQKPKAIAEREENTLYINKAKGYC